MTNLYYGITPEICPPWEEFIEGYIKRFATDFITEHVPEPVEQDKEAIHMFFVGKVVNKYVMPV